MKLYFVTFYFFMVSVMFLLFLYFYMVKNMCYLIFEYNISYFNYLDISLYLNFDWISILFMIVVFFISGMVIYYSNYYMEGDLHAKKFLILVILFVVSMLLVISSSNVLMLVLGWDMLGLVSYCLVIFYNNESSSSAGMITMMTNRLGDFGLVMGILLSIMLSSLNYIEMSKMITFLSLMILLAAFTKSAQMPFSSWLPAAMAAPTPVSSLVHSSTLVTAGVYMIIRLNSLFMNDLLMDYMMSVSVMTMFMAGLCAIFEMDLKKIIAYSTLSQLGVMMMILSVGKLELAFFHLISHALFKAMLFLCAGAIIHNMGGWQDIRKLSMINFFSPFISMVMMMGSMCLFGIPFLSGFYSKDLILEFLYSMNNSFILLFMIIMGTLFSVYYSLRLIYYLFLNQNSINMININKMSNMYIPIYIMSLIVVIFGSIMNWIVFLQWNCIFLIKMTKMINMVIIIFSFYVFIYEFLVNKLMILKNMNFMMYFISEMWFLKNITSGIFMNSFEVKKYIMMNENWIEELGAQGIEEEISNLMLKMFLWNFLGLKNFLFIMMILLIMLLII